jgi:hypothetical protein
MEFTLLWAALTAAALAWVGTRVWPAGLPDRPADHLVAAAAVGLFLGRLAAMAIQGVNPLTNPGDILFVRGGVHAATATAGAIAAYSWSVRGRIGYLDATAPAALLGLAGWHGGCLWRGACLGVASDMPWTWSEPGSLVTRHPVEIYVALALAAAAWALSRLPLLPMLRSGLGLALVGVVRLVSEPLRLSFTDDAWPWYLAAILIGVSAASFGRKLPIPARLE